ncbi:MULTISPECIES: hypothetical protein [Caproicibacterium]|jgi:hypothetical protein|nr:hypothetical protein [Caproicibacterium lactatifermentans]MDD4806973.1 hypothetical protein [Oscillospiraceae bacterium]QKN24666.1 hypothetical protein GJQ69_09380 [Caproicibacterium lactatifermentans]
MDNWKWGQEYLQEAEVLKKHLLPVRKALKSRTLGVEESQKFAQRESMLYQMYLECRATGRHLQESRP